MAVVRLKINLLVLFFLSAWAFIAMAADEGGLSRLERAKRIFDLRRALRDAPDGEQDARFYHALIDARFGREEAAVEKFRALLATNPSDEMARNAHHDLADALTRLGRYGEAAAEFDQTLRLMSPSDPERKELINSRATFTALKDVSPQTIEFAAEVPLTARPSKIGLLSVPVEANGRRAEWMLDTGAFFSTVTESEAKRVGLTLLDFGGSGSSGHTGNEVPIRLAVAMELRIGAAHLRNIVFAVVPDSALNFGPDGRLTGIVGLPAIRALGSIAISANGAVRIHSESTRPRGEPNVFFDGLTPIAEVHHAGRAMPMTLDTGGTTTYLYSAFREALTAEERAKLSQQNRRFGGVNGSIKTKIELVPQLELELPGKTVALRRVALRSDINHTPSYSDGLLGIDALKGGFSIDFNTMRLELDQ
jgi:tetratricopeptide (TPR) repeat protein